MRAIAIGLAWAALASAGMAQSPPPDPMAVAHAESAAAPAVTATVRYGADDMHSGTLRIPAGKGRFPVVMLVHGGCWTKGFDTRAGIEALGAALARRGFAVWNVEYRMLGDPGAGWPGTFQDVAAAEDYLTVLAKRYPLDLKRVSIVGHSAGAHLALWAASRAKLGGAWTPKVQPVSVVAIDGPGALAPFVGIDQQICGGPVITRLMGGTPAARAAEFALASPADQLPLGVHTLLVEAELAMAVKLYAAAARNAGERVDELEPAGANHFDIITPSTKNGAAVVDFIATKAFAGN